MGKPQFYPKVFDIDISVCMSCQICVEVCPFEAIKMDKDFELSKRERFDALLFRKEELSKSNEYYHRIHPVESAAVDKNLADAAAAAEAKKKAAVEAAAKAAAAKASSVGDAVSVPGKPTQPSPEATARRAASPTAQNPASKSVPGEAPPTTAKS
jgi:NADH-quinone oxidoreductase subunit I